MFWSLTHQNPNYTLCCNNDRDTWPHLLSSCKNPYIKGLRIAQYNKAVHLIAQTLQANKTLGFLHWPKASNLNNHPPTTQSRTGSSKCTRTQTIFQCQAKLRPDILCIIGALNQTQIPISPSLALTVQLIEFTFYHDICLDQALTHKHTKIQPIN